MSVLPFTEVRRALIKMRTSGKFRIDVFLSRLRGLAPTTPRNLAALVRLLSDPDKPYTAIEPNTKVELDKLLQSVEPSVLGTLSRLVAGLEEMADEDWVELQRATKKCRDRVSGALGAPIPDVTLMEVLVLVPLRRFSSSAFTQLDVDERDEAVGRHIAHAFGLQIVTMGMLENAKTSRERLAELDPITRETSTRLEQIEADLRKSLDG